MWVKSDFTIFGEQYIKIRSSLKYKGDACIKCDNPFKIGDMIGLVCFEGIGNKVVCQKCAEEISDPIAQTARATIS